MRGVGEQEQRGLLGVGQSKSRNDIPSTVKHGGAGGFGGGGWRCVREDLDSLSD